jgi:hypothetical protein
VCGLRAAGIVQLLVAVAFSIWTRRVAVARSHLWKFVRDKNMKTEVRSPAGAKEPVIDAYDTKRLK